LLHFGEALDDRVDAVAEARAGQVAYTISILVCWPSWACRLPARSISDWRRTAASGMAKRGSAIQTLSTRSNVSTSFGRARETISAISALAARWSSRSFPSQASFQFLVCFVSQKMVPQA
jgi:hypothetical protein